ncbi:DnaB-like helicase C-terminal domain-containing protein [Candidatus Phytoplasma oryzae]|uniref:DnaB-like helicase C-terminal domain-containing protein n=1 Tax=Candidatus Phytoplasma oryzae TaxID=203274 RepID=UPI0024827857|nr:DnaB-like helicase C-terminal domain-containing protein [Candidatus Phytoplasma oryzae]
MSKNKRNNYKQNSKQFLGWFTGFAALDEMTGGWQPEQLVILAARPGMGKTTFMLNLMLKAFANNEHLKVAVFSLEMNSIQLGLRCLSMMTHIPFRQLQTYSFQAFSTQEQKLIETKTEEINYYQLFLDDEGLNTMTHIKEKCRWLKQTKGLNLVFIDYLQLLKAFESDKALKSYETVSQISRELKLLAKELKMTIICLSQLSREIEKREKKRPQLSDLRDSGSIEQDADIVIFLARFQPENIDFHREIVETEVIIAKNRNGQIGQCPFLFHLKIQKFEEKKLY